MTIHQSLTLVILAIIMSSCSPQLKFQKQSIGLINNVSFVDSKFDNPNASNGFLVQHDKQTYAVTAKHILMIAKSDKMKFVDFEGELKQWKMHPKNDNTSFITTEKLLNTNRVDSLTWDYMFTNWETYDDWLVFSIKEHETTHKALKFREQPLEKGDELFAIGWSYSDSVGTQRIYEYTYEDTEDNYHNLLQITGPKRLGGLSGAPIVDKKGALVGLVTSGGADEETNEIYLQATSSKNILQFISQLE